MTRPAVNDTPALKPIPPKVAVKAPAPRKPDSPADIRHRVATPPSRPPSSDMGLHTAEGARKYLTAGERDAFLRQAELADRQVRTLCMTLA